MAGSLQILKSSLSPFPTLPHPNKFTNRFDSRAHSRPLIGFWRSSVNGGVVKRRVRVNCQIQGGDSKNSDFVPGEERPESLFMKELKKRGITPTSLLEESNRSTFEEEIQAKERATAFQDREADINKNLTNQREQSLALNSEGLEGLVPRGKLLLTLGGTFFLAFGPLILATVSAFAALYICFGPSFIHDGNGSTTDPPPYIDPYVLLQDERISQTAPRFK